MIKRLLSLTALALMSMPALAGETPSPEGAKVYFIGLEDGASVSSPVTVRFGLRGMGVAPAGVRQDNTGHHHLIIDEAIEGDELNMPIPADDNHIHFGGGQTETTLELAPGTYTMQLVLGDWVHIPHDAPVMSERITVTVE